MKEINLKFPFYLARNAEHYQVHSDILDEATESFADEVGMAGMRENYQAQFDIENDCYLRSRTYESTPEIVSSDKYRISRFNYVSKSIDCQLYSLDAEKVEAAKKLDAEINKYRKNYVKGYAQRTAAIGDFVLAVREEKNQPYVATLGLESAINDLDEANKDFNELYSSRSSERLQRASAETMKSIRPKVDDAFIELASTINALYRINNLIEKDSDKEAKLDVVIDAINSHLYQLQLTLSRSKVAAKPEIPDEEEPDEEEPSTDVADDDEEQVAVPHP